MSTCRSRHERFATIAAGTRLRRSKRWSRANPSWPRGQLGILVSTHQTTGSNRKPLVYPIVHWEGEAGPAPTHPDFVDVAASRYASVVKQRPSKAAR